MHDKAGECSEFDWGCAFAELEQAQRLAISQIRQENSERFWELYDAYLESPSWKAKAAFRLREDEYQCRAKRPGICTFMATQVHHLSYARVGCEQHIDLLSVCAACHETITAEDRASMVRPHEIRADLTLRMSHATGGVEHQPTPTSLVLPDQPVAGALFPPGRSLKVIKSSQIGIVTEVRRSKYPPHNPRIFLRHANGDLNYYMDELAQVEGLPVVNTRTGEASCVWRQGMSRVDGQLRIGLAQQAMFDGSSALLRWDNAVDWVTAARLNAA